jgi:hypothetical protein
LSFSCFSLTFGVAVSYSCFTITANGLILANMVFESISDDEEILEKFDIIDRVLFFTYAAEAIIKLLGLGIRNYFNNDSNK